MYQNYLEALVSNWRVQGFTQGQLNQIPQEICVLIYILTDEQLSLEKLSQFSARDKTPGVSSATALSGHRQVTLCNVLQSVSSSEYRDNKDAKT